MAMLVHQPTNSVGNYNYNAYFYQNYRMYYHFHGNYEVVYMVSGKADIMVDNRTEELTEGSFALILPNQLHSFSNSEGSEMWICVFSEEYVFRFDSQIRNMEGSKSGFFCAEPVKAFVLEYLINGKSEDIDMRKACFYALCSEYKRQVELKARNRGDNTVCLRMVDYVAGKFREPITLKGMAEEMGYDHHYLSRAFHEMFHMNFRDFVNQYRINYANELLMQGGRSITEVAFESGFQSVRSFNDVYKKMTGSVPSKKEDIRSLPTVNSVSLEKF